MKFDPRRVIQRLIRRVTQKKARGVSPPQSVAAIDLAIKLPATYTDAAKALTDFKALSTPKHLNATLKTSRERAHPSIVEFYVKFGKEMERRGVPMYATEFYRSPERQERLKRQGVTKAGPGSSPHQYGCAVDIVHTFKLWDLTQRQWDMVGVIGKEVARRMNCKIIWGGDWNDNGVHVHTDPSERFWDPAHWELAEWRYIRSAASDMEHEGIQRHANDRIYFGELDRRAKLIKKQLS